ncbi:hypothetical protein [Mesorhizobium sp.]|uniref:hypothetical protein n=1 Tax=Mesorhizobium sp. TaxID=1871066 RepID=UPI00120BEA5D|nr:hypothetical protein [Mesorhizobium sp.]TIO36538.1 MAG: hypothetical protein E5X89_00540 [Mesorhizobium sp.]
MQKFSIDPERLAASIAAAEGANAASIAASRDEAEARSKLQKVLAKISAEVRFGKTGVQMESREELAKTQQNEVAGLEAEIQRLKVRKDLLTEKWIHLSSIAERCREYATRHQPRLLMSRGLPEEYRFGDPK